MPKCRWKMTYESKDGQLKRGRVNIALDNIQQVLLSELLPILLLLRLMFIGLNFFLSLVCVKRFKLHT